ncbi:MAG: glycine--tRNA ligase subunit beta [Deltaproteobacteria bacterium]|nr:MAG: glycine--tRNA ligase subunit beta [Deltaproteobacteria bacterium]
MPATRDLLLEIGTEELPAAFLAPALRELERRLLEALEEWRLAHGACHTYGTPRRLAAIVEGVAETQTDLTEVITGPPKRAAFDAEGRPTRAAEGFAARHGVPVEALEIVETPKGPYVAARVHHSGRPAAEVLAAHLGEVVASLHFPKRMRWGTVAVSFARPVHWICALFGGKKLVFEFGDVVSDNKTRGHRFLAPDPILLRSPGQYLAKLREAKVLADPEERHQAILEGATRVVQGEDAGWRLREDPELLDEVRWLVEWPVPLLGRFDPSFLDLPPEVLVSEMRHHQKYFSVEDEAGRLVPRFVAVSNTPVKDPALSVHGYERVLAARLADARYFYETDRKKRLAEWAKELERVVFHRDLGTVAEKVERIRGLALWMASRLGLETRQATIARTAALAKADLVTGMVGEFPDLQGVMGSYYAAADGEPEAVALGIREHYLPRGAGDPLPTAHEGALVGLADRIDTLVGLFGVGKPPSGTADPFGLRRAALAVIRIVLGRGYRLPLSETLDQGLSLLAEKLKRPADETRVEVLDFFQARLRNLWSEHHPVDVVDAVLAAGFDDLLAAKERLEAVSAMRERAEFEPLAIAFTRAANIVRKGTVVEAKEIDPELFEADAERELWKALLAVREKAERQIGAHDYLGALESLVALKAPVDRFFDEVLVMAEDARIRDNRLLLLRGIVSLFARIADFARIQTREG